MDFFYLSDSNRCHKTKIRLKKKKKSVYTTKTYFTTDQRYLLQRATQHKKTLSYSTTTWQHANMPKCQQKQTGLSQAKAKVKAQRAVTSELCVILS